MPDRDLYIKVHADDKELGEIYNKLRAIGGQSKITAKDLGLFEEAVKKGAISTREFNSAQEAAIRNAKREQDELQRRGRLIEQAIAEDQRRAAAAEKAATAEAAALQRRGQLIARAEADDRRRTASLNAQQAAQERLNRTQNLSLARGATSLGSFAGVLPGGAGQGISGLSGLLGGGLSGGTLATAGIVAGLAGVTAITIKAANSLGTYAREQQNLAERTGLTTHETQLFSRAAGIVDVNAGTLTTSMRTLSKALSENSEEGKKAKQALAELGIGDAERFAPMGELLATIYRKLAAIPDGAEKDRIAIALFGRSALELLPLINQFDALTGAVNRSGVVIDEQGIQKALAYQRKVKELGLEWDALVNKFKQKAVGTVSFVLSLDGKTKQLIQDANKAGGTNGKPGLLGQLDIGTSALLYGLFGRDEGLEPGKGDVLPTAPRSPIGSVDASKVRASQREEELTAIKGKFQTPKERLDDRIKSLKDAAKVADDTFRAASLTEKPQAQANVEGLERQIRASEDQRDALKDAKRSSEEILRLQEKLLEVKAKELTGEEKINAEYDAQIKKLKDKKELNATSLALAGEVRDVQLERFRQQVAIGAIQNRRRTGNVLFETQRGVERDVLSGTAQIEAAQGKQGGDEEGGIERAKQTRLQLAQLDFSLAARRIEDLRKESAEREAVVHDQIKLEKEQAQIRQAQIQASGAFAKEVNDAEKQAIVDRIALDQKHRQEADTVAENEIRRTRVLSDLELARNRTIAEGRTRLSVTQAAPGFQLQAELNADRERLELDRKQAALNLTRNNADVQALQARLVGDPKRDFELTEKIKDIRLSSTQEAARIENDTIRARFDAELRIAEERKRQQENFVGTVQGGFRALVSGGSTGLGQFAKGQALGVAETVVGNAARIFYKDQGLANKFSLPGTGTAESPTRLGQLLGGTIFGPQAKNPIVASQDKLVSSQDLLRAAVDRNTATQTAIVTGQPLPSGASSTAGGLSTFGLGLPPSLTLPGLGALGSAVGVFGSDTQGITGRGPLVAPSASTLPGASRSFGGLGGFLGGAAHAGDLTGIFSGVSNTKNGAESLSGAERLGGAVATAGILYGAERGIAAGIRQGGAKGFLSAGASGLGAAAALDQEPISKAVLGTAAAVTGFISALLPDPRVVRQRQIEKELATNVYQAPVAQNRTQDIFGNYTDYDKYGKVRTSDLSAIPQITQPYITRRNGVYYDVPGQVTSQFGGVTAAPTPPAPPANPITVHQTINVSSLDPKSGADYFKANPDVGHAAVHYGLNQASGPAHETVRRAALGA